MNIDKNSWALPVVCFVASLALAQNLTDTNIVANQNRVSAGRLEGGVLNIQLEMREGLWHPEAENGPVLHVQAFGETGHAAQIPGPMIRVPSGTTVHATVKNTLKMKATVYGLNTRPGDPKAGVEIDPGESKDISFAAGEPGTYFYWARASSTDRPDVPPIRSDAQLNGAFIVDAAGETLPDRVIVMNAMFVKPDIMHDALEVVSLNGKLYPFTEGLEYTQGERIRWRVINAAASEHPMHLHGAFFDLLAVGNFESEAKFASDERQSVVTQTMPRQSTMMMEWAPPHAGRWFFHCHFHAHISSDKRVPMFLENVNSAPPKSEHDGMAMQDMAGLVLAITVKSKAGTTREPASTKAPRKIDLVVEPTVASSKAQAFSCMVREGKKIVASEEKAMGPPIVVTRGEPVEITVLNHLAAPTTIHWHGIELESYYDGVVGGGMGSQMTPAIKPGQSFTAKFTPNRAGTYIYHTHSPQPEQLTGGVYGALIVVEPGEKFDPTTDKLLVIGTRDADFYAKRLTLSGEETPGPIVLHAGAKYRMRVINIAPELMADLVLGTKENPAQWTPIAKDGAALPARLIKSSDANLHIDSGETYDFDFEPKTPGEIPLLVKNDLNTATLSTVVKVE